jgi:hypothetical protein
MLKGGGGGRGEQGAHLDEGRAEGRSVIGQVGQQPRRRAEADGAGKSLKGEVGGAQLQGVTEGGDAMGRGELIVRDVAQGGR